MVRTLISALLILAAIVLPTVPWASAQNKKDGKEEAKNSVEEQVIAGVVDLYKKVMEKELDLKVKSGTVVEAASPLGGKNAPKKKCVRILAEFTKDSNKQVWDGSVFTVAHKYPPEMLFYFFDAENVRIGSRAVRFDLGINYKRDFEPWIDGEITLKKGEAIRVFVPVEDLLSGIAPLLKDTKRLEVHFRVPDRSDPSKDFKKDKDDKKDK